MTEKIKRTQIIFWTCAIVANALMDHAQFRAYGGWQWDEWHILKQFMFLFFALAITRKLSYLFVLGMITLVTHYVVYHIILY